MPITRGQGNTAVAVIELHCFFRGRTILQLECYQFLLNQYFFKVMRCYDDGVISTSQIILIANNFNWENTTVVGKDVYCFCKVMQSYDDNAISARQTSFNSSSNAYSETCQTSKMELLAVTYIHKKLHLRCLTGFWICLWAALQELPAFQIRGA